MKRALICVWGPELGCLMRDLQLAKKMIETGDFEISFYCHSHQTRAIQNFFGPDSDIHTYDKMLSIKYNSRFDLVPLQTLLATMEFILMGFIPEYISFKRIVKNIRPDFVINDFMPHVSLYAKSIGVPCVGIQNYVCAGILDNKSIMEFLFWLGFSSSYSLHNYNLVETFFPETLPKINKTTWTTPVAYTVDRTRNSINEELGIKNREKIVFLALGGASTNLACLKKIHDHAGEYPDIKILLLPRNDKEAQEFPVLFPNFVHTRRVVYDTYNYVGNSDIVISKCGFRTVAEAFKNRVMLIPFHTPAHPEIYQTEKLLQEHGFTYTSIFETDTAEQFWDKIVATLENSNSREYPCISYMGDIEISDFLKHCPNRIVK